MMDELRASDPTALRPTADIERLVDAPWYRVGRSVVRGLDPWDLRVRRLGRRLRKRGKRARRFGRQVVQLGRRSVRRLRRTARRLLP